MFDNIPTHRIQKHILKVLVYIQYGRFKDLKPANIDTNLYSYHLKSLQKTGWIEKTSSGYTLSSKGLIFIDRISLEKLNIRTQSKIITMLLIKNKNGEILLQKRLKQPYINTWTLPYGKSHIEDESILEGAKRESLEKIGLDLSNLIHEGDCYIRVRKGNETESSTIAHIFSATVTDQYIINMENSRWINPSSRLEYRLKFAPATENIINYTLSNNRPKHTSFFKEFTVEH